MSDKVDEIHIFPTLQYDDDLCMMEKNTLLPNSLEHILKENEIKEVRANFVEDGNEGVIANESTPIAYTFAATQHYVNGLYMTETDMVMPNSLELSMNNEINVVPTTFIQDKSEDKIANESAVIRENSSENNITVIQNESSYNMGPTVYELMLDDKPSNSSKEHFNNNVNFETLLSVHQSCEIKGIQESVGAEFDTNKSLEVLKVCDNEEGDGQNCVLFSTRIPSPYLLALVIIVTIMLAAVPLFLIYI